MKTCFIALNGRDWEEYKKNAFRKEVKATEWAFHRIKEAFEQVAQDEARKLGTVREIMVRSTDNLRRIIFDQCFEVAGEQQEDGDGLLQNIVTNLGKGSRKGLTDCLREFLKIDNEHGNIQCSEAESSRRMPGGDSQGEPRWIDASSSGSGYVEGICQCRPHRKREMGSTWWITTDTPSVRRCLKVSKEKTGERCMRLTKN